MTEEALFRIVFNGVTTGEYDLETTKKRFQKLFRLQAPKVEKLFSGKEYILKSNLAESVAMDFAFKLADVGCECAIESMPADDDISLAPDFVERRHSGERRIRFRRGPRPGAIIPDRRTNNGRRRTDEQVSAQKTASS